MRLWRSIFAGSVSMLVVAQVAATPNFNGVWLPANDVTALQTEDGQLPPLLPEAKAIYEANVTARQQGDTGFDPTMRCQPPGIPRAYFMGPMEVQQDGKFIYINFEFNRFFRVIDLDVTHGQQDIYAPTYYGWSTGYWDDDTLVIDGIFFNDTTLLDAAGLPHSMDLHVIERWEMTDNSHLKMTITLEDPQMYSRPWRFSAQFERAPKGTEILEDVCLERMQ